MTIPGTGAITAVSYAAAIEDPDNFRTSRSVGAWLGLTTRRYQSGEVDYDGHISRRGDNRLRGLLYEAATAMLTRTSAKNESRLKDWVPIPMKPPLCSEMIAPPVSGMISPPV
jgi:error-prone DNA polymerase